MQPTDDSALLRQYAENHSDVAFTALVARHVNLVYSVALRHVGDPHQAEEIAQAVFILLAKKAAQLRHDKALSSWLFQAARLTASNFVRGESRRHRREQEAHMQSVLNESGSEVWPRIAPLLDDAVAGLSEADRHAIMLRFYEGRNLREVGAALGASEDAAEKRVSRAVERLREFFAKRGITVGASGLVVVLSANAVQAAPVGLAVTISTAAALAGTTIATAATTTAIKTIAMTTLQKTLITATAAVLAGAGIYEAIQNSKLRKENESQQQQIAQLKLENESLSNRLPVVAGAKPLPDEQFNELLRLRGQVGVLRGQKAELENSLANMRKSQPRGSNPVAQQQPQSALRDEYPKTADGAAKGIFESIALGDWDAFYSKFDVDGGRELFDKALTTEAKSSLLGLEVVSVGTPTNSFGPNMWFVPYTIRFKNGDVKTMRLHIAQDSQTQRWILKGGL